MSDRSFTGRLLAHQRTEREAVHAAGSSHAQGRRLKIARWKAQITRAKSELGGAAPRSLVSAEERSARLRDALSQARSRSARVELEYPSAERRKALFEEADKNGNGKLSLAEIDLAVKLRWPGFDHPQALMRAHRMADKKEDGWISRSDDEARCEWSHFLKYLALYTEYWNRFERLDLNADRSVDLAEWKQHGNSCLGLSGEAALRDEDLEGAFADADADGSGRVRFDEFCAWAAKAFGDNEVAGDQRVWRPHQRHRVRRALAEARQHPQWHSEQV